MEIKMKDVISKGYISGVYALNLPCSLETCGDWHHDALDWSKVKKVTDINLFKTYGLEYKYLQETNTFEYVANHIRALLDLLIEGKFVSASGMNKDFICNKKYDLEIFKKVYLLKDTSKWKDINLFMLKEYGRKWKKFVEERSNGT